MRTLPLLILLSCADTVKDAPETDSGLDETDTDTDTDADTDTDTDTDVPCTATVTSLSPVDGSVDVSIETTVVAAFSEAVTVADITVDGGANGTVTLADDGLTAVWTPDAALSRDTAYTATASVCDGGLSTSFTTAGEAITIDLTDRTFDVELDGSDLTWVKPSQGRLIVGQIDTTDVLFMVQSATADELDLLGAAGFDDGGTTQQYPCTYAIDFPATSFSANPAFTAGPLDTEMVTGDTSFAVYDLAASGIIADDGEEMNDVIVTGLIDTRNLDEAAGFDVCDAMANFGDDCVACPDDGVVKCLELEVHDERAPWIEGLLLDADQDPTTDARCN